MTAPFAPEVAQLITQAHEQTLTATAIPSTGAPFPLSIQDFTVSWDEDRSPRVIAQLDCVPLTDLDALARFDPRTDARVTLQVTYRLPDGTQDTHQVADLGLRERETDRPENVMRLSLASDEARYIDATHNLVPDSPGTEYLYPDAIFAVRANVNSMANHDLATDVTVDPSLPSTPAAQLEFPQSVLNDKWQAASDAAEALDADLYDNGDRVMRLTRRRYVTAESALTVSIGANGTLISSSSTVTRESWFNEYAIRWNYQADPWDGFVNGSATLTGPYAPSAVGLRRHSESREGKPAQWAADAIAAAGLNRAQARARAYRVEAISAWWVRPGDTVTLQLPTGDQRRLMASSIAHRTGGLMALVLRTPTDTTSTGE